jgi:zinc D-Ala-D-Ala carboxypeptidase
LAEAEQGARGHRRLTAAAAVAAVGLVGAGAAVARSTPSEASTAASADLANPGLIVTKAVDRQSVEASGTPAAGLARAAAGLPGSDRSTFRMKAVSRSRTRTPVTSSSAPTSGCSGVRPSAHFSNGQIPVSSLCALPFAEGHMLRADAAVQIIRLNAAYRAKFGVDIGMTDSYRSLSAQFNLAARKPGLAARPGTSEHGWGLAVDLSEGPDQVNSVRRAWFLLNAPRFGWDNPAWARPGGSKPEPWHWEFVRGV